MDAGIIHQNLDRGYCQQIFDGGPGGRVVGHIELHDLGLAAGRKDLAHDDIGRGSPAICMHIHEMTGSTQLLADRRPYAAAATRDQGSFFRIVHSCNRSFASKITVARPLNKGIAPDRK
jgi:hypothetical protein